MIQLTLVEPRVKVTRMVDGTATLMFHDVKSGIAIVVPFDEKSAREVGGKLASKLHIANGNDLPPKGAA